MRTAGSVVELVSRWQSATKATPHTTRGRVRCFSARSRSRLFRAMAAVNWDLLGDGFFITLTYPGAWSTSTGEHLDNDESKRHLRAFRSRLERKYGPVVAAWKMEFQRRGAVHFHLAVVVPTVNHDVPEDVAEFRRWLSLAWYEVAGSNDGRHLVAGTQVQRLDHHPAAYFAGYVGGSKGAKEYQHTVPEGFENVGRFWGTWRCQPEWAEARVAEHEWDQLRAEMVAYRSRTRRSTAELRAPVRPLGAWLALRDRPAVEWLGATSAELLGRFVVGVPPDDRRRDRVASAERALLTAAWSAAAIGAPNRTLAECAVKPPPNASAIAAHEWPSFTAASTPSSSHAVSERTAAAPVVTPSSGLATASWPVT